MKKTILIILLFITISILKSQVLSQIPQIESYIKIASAVNGGPTLTSGDRFGMSVANIGDLNDDGIEDMVVGAGFDDDGGVSSVDKGAVYVCFMNSSKTVSSYVRIGASTTGFTGLLDNGDNFGVSVAGIGDLNNDGYEDIAVGAHLDDDNATNSGAVYIIFLNSSAAIVDKKKISYNTNGLGTDLVGSGFFGGSVASIGDVDDDGVNDIAVGAFGQTVSSRVIGAAWVLKMNTTGTVKEDIYITQGAGGFAGSFDLDDRFGFAVSGAGDLNGDNIDDVVVTASRDDDGFSNAGAVYLLYLNNDGTVNSEKKLSLPFTTGNYFSHTSDINFGKSICTGDINQDGITDLFVGGHTADSWGAMFILLLNSANDITACRKVGLNSTGNFIYPSYNENFGVGISPISDMDNDGHLDFLVGCMLHNETSTNQGDVLVMSFDTIIDNDTGKVVRFTKISDFSGNFTATFENSDLFGHGVEKIGDVNDDGIDDIAVGSPYDNDGGTDRGVVWILFLDANGNVSSSAKIQSGTTNFVTLDNSDLFGWSVHGPGDLDADGVPDLLASAIQDDDGGTDRGAVYVIYLNADGTVKGNSKIVHGSHASISLVNSGNFGSDMAVIGDVDSDGVNDWVVGNHLDTDGASGNGAVWILLMNSNETVKGAQKISDTQGSFSATFAGTNPSFGTSVDAGVDYDADGIEDIVVGAPNMDSKGAVFIIYINSSGVATGYKKLSSTGGSWPYTLATGKTFGTGVAIINDFDDNGVRDLIIGQPLEQCYLKNKGACLIALLDASENVIDVYPVSDSLGRLYNNGYDDDRFGHRVSYYGVNTSDELIFLSSAPNNDDGGTDRGSVNYIVTSGQTSNKNPPLVLAELKKKLDGGYYQTVAGVLHFQYVDKYNNTQDELTFNIYDKLNTVVYSQTNLTISEDYGDNRLSINCNCTNGAGLGIGYYILEVINSKNEKYYLRFYQNVNGECP